MICFRNKFALCKRISKSKIDKYDYKKMDIRTCDYKEPSLLSRPVLTQNVHEDNQRSGRAKGESSPLH